MERAIWKLVCCLVSLLFLELCNGLPIGLDHTYGDGHTQFLTGLIAILLTICGVVCLAGCMCCQRKDGFKEFENVGTEAVPNNLDHGHINPLASTSNRNEFTIFNPLTKDTPSQQNIFTQQDQDVIVHNEDDWRHDHIDVSSWFGKGETEFPRTRLKYIRELGKGWFGRVVEGTAQDFDVNDKDAWKPVVVRILEASASSRQRILFLHDASIYRCTPHPNILILLGRSLDNVPLLLLQEYTNQGDLKSFLKKHLSNKEVILNSDLAIRWCYQLTSALKHLHSSSITHLDLATRNCRLTDSVDLKLGDYGCSTTDYPEDYYHGTENIPIRWCAPESVTYTATTIQTKNVSQCNNIWSLGVCYWEIYECGAQPYGELTDDEVVSQVLGPPKIRLSKPKINVLFTDYMYRLMQLCWSNNELRPTINQIYPMVEDLMNVVKNSSTHDSLPDFDKRWDSFKPNFKQDNYQVSQWNHAVSSRFEHIADSFENIDHSWSTTNLFHDTHDLTSTDKQVNQLQSTDRKFKLGPLNNTIRTSSESETEDENWKRKVEHGLYTEKVRQKSRSVADLMILTHIDYSESDSETPLPSINYKNVRYAAPIYKENLENVSLTFGSEGNLLNVQNTFEEELRKMQEERRDSLLFVPDKSSSVSSPSKIFDDLNSSSAIEPLNQIFNVYNVVQISPVHALELNKIINYNEDISQPLPDVVINTIATKREIPKLSEIIENNIELMDYIIAKYDPEDEYLLVEVNSGEGVPTGNEKVPDTDDGSNLKLQDVKKLQQCDVVKGESSESEEYVTANTHTVTDTDEITDNTSGSEQKALKRMSGALAEDNFHELLTKKLSGSIEDDDSEDFFTPMSQQNSDSDDELSDRTYCCDKPTVTNSEVVDDINNVPNRSFSIVQIEGLLEDDHPLQNIEANHRKEYEMLHNVEECHNTENHTLDLLNHANNVVMNDAINNHTLSPTQDFLNNEILRYENATSTCIMCVDTEVLMVDDSLKSFTSTPCSKRTRESMFPSKSHGNDELLSQDEMESKKSDLKYSLETWDNFLGKSFDEQHEFDDYSDEPMSLLFTEEQNECLSKATILLETNQDQLVEVQGLNQTFVKAAEDEDVDRNIRFIKYDNLPTPEEIIPTSLEDDNVDSDVTFIKEVDLNGTFDKEVDLNRTFIKEVDPSDIHLQMQEDIECYDNPGYWEHENSGGWYLHPQGNDEDLQGEIDLSQGEEGSYIRSSMDDEVMAAIRNELMMKLPHAQKAACEQNDEADGEYETTDRNEVFLRYNCFNMPLSPIPEESYSEYLNSGQSTPHCTINTDLGGSDSDSVWSEAGLGPASLEEDTHSPRLMESPHKGTQNRHTPSQDSCCSNDTLFNLEELQCNEKQLQEIEERNRRSEETKQCIRKLLNDAVDKALVLSGLNVNNDNDCEMNHTAMTPCESDNIDSMPSSIDVTVIKVEKSREEHIANTKSTALSPKVVIQEFIDQERTASVHVHALSESTKEYLSAGSDTVCFTLQNVAPLNSPEDRPWKHIEASLTKCSQVQEERETSINDYEYIENKKNEGEIDDIYEKEMNYKNTLSSMENEELYDCIDTVQSNIENNVIYANNSYEIPAYVNSEVKDRVYENVCDYNEEGMVEYENVHGNNLFREDEYCPLGDIRFSGPGDMQMMTTSFSESNDLDDEHDWDSGSDTRSSSSGEFIWKEGEHEASVKALQAVPQEEIAHSEDLNDDDDSSSCSDEDGEGIEFVPSAWDKFALPIKSAMRSPEKSLDRKKDRGVSFKKQKYHCVYEYPREPEPTVIQNYDLWKDPSYIGSSTLDDDFYISSSAKPFDMLGSATSQFFPGKHCDWSELIKNNDNVTPDSGVEDITPGSMSDSSDYVRPNRQILPLKTLAQLAANKNVNVGSVEIGGLRHTRNKLKLDLPPSPSAFTKSKSFTVDSPEPPALSRSIPTFTTFGKSRFFVQQVDTTANSDSKSNVSFEALPYKPVSKLIKNELNGHSEKSRIEVVRGEASLLDSADEDSGIESCTLERKNVSEVSE